MGLGLGEVVARGQERETSGWKPWDKPASLERTEVGMNVHRFVYIVGIVALVGCGGETTTAGDDAGHSPEGSGSGTGSSGIGSGSSDAAPVCDVPPDTGQQSCVMCADEWHCSGGTVMPQCAAGFAGAGTCTGFSACLACTSAGTGQSWSCDNGAWSTTPELTLCSQ